MVEQRTAKPLIWIAGTKHDLKSLPDGDGSLAMLRAAWSATAPGPDGKPVTITGNNVEVVRRHPDGTWLFVIDNPRGAD